MLEASWSLFSVVGQCISQFGCSAAASEVEALVHMVAPLDTCPSMPFGLSLSSKAYRRALIACFRPSTGPSSYERKPQNGLGLVPVDRARTLKAKNNVARSQDRLFSFFCLLLFLILSATYLGSRHSSRVLAILQSATHCPLLPNSFVPVSNPDYNTSFRVPYQYLYPQHPASSPPDSFRLHLPAVLLEHLPDQLDDRLPAKPSSRSPTTTPIALCDSGRDTMSTSTPPSSTEASDEHHSDSSKLRIFVGILKKSVMAANRQPPVVSPARHDTDRPSLLADLSASPTLPQFGSLCPPNYSSQHPISNTGTI